MKLILKEHEKYTLSLHLCLLTRRYILVKQNREKNCRKSNLNWKHSTHLNISDYFIKFAHTSRYCKPLYSAKWCTNRAAHMSPATL
ncbi:unnamed protein product [Brugia timori]|uniref:Ovule protein n=1 Tax=Brugia timori TaxID=42155 RepID=A0A0R3QWN9_9BILA|nr:unnamed protein product [Brugia timori]